MNLRYLIEVAAWASIQSSLVLDSQHQMESAHAQSWAAATRKLFTALRTPLDDIANESISRPVSLSDPRWSQVREAIDGAFLGETLVRVWTAVLRGRTCADADFGQAVDPVQSRSKTLVRRAFADVMSLRHLVLTFMCDERSLCPDALVIADRTRRRCERWNDLLLGPLLGKCPVDDLCFDEERVADFAEGSLAAGVGHPEHRVWHLVLTGMRLAFPGTPPRDKQIESACQNTAQIVLSAFPADAYVATSPFTDELRSLARAGANAISQGASGLTAHLPALPPLGPFRPHGTSDTTGVRGWN